MPQYRVTLNVITTELVDVVADNEADALLAGAAAFGGTRGALIQPVSAKQVAGVYTPEPAAMEGDEG
jgi:hypothetical protein